MQTKIIYRSVTMLLTDLNRSDYEYLEKLLENHRKLYNKALGYMNHVYKTTSKTVTYIDLYKKLTEWKEFNKGMSAISVGIHRGALDILIKAHKAFLKNCKDRKNNKTTRIVGFPKKNKTTPAPHEQANKRKSDVECCEAFI